MKKFFVFVLGCIAATGAFANFEFGLSQIINAHIFSSTSPTGLYAQSSVPDPLTGDPVHNTGVPQGTLARGILFPVVNGNTGYYTPGGYNFFTTRVFPDTSVMSNGSWTAWNSVGLTMRYNSGNLFQAYMRLDGTPLLDSMLNRSSASTISGILGFFRIDEYWFRANHPMFMLWYGERVFPTKVEVYQDFSDWSGRMRVDFFGVNVPSRPNDDHFVFGTRSNNLFRDVINPREAGNPSNVNNFATSGYFIGSVKLLNHFFQIPITIDVGMDLGNAVQSAINQGATNSGQTRVAGGVRVSGENIAKMFNFDLTYKMRGGDSSRDDSWDPDIPGGGGVQPDGTGAMSHVLGLAIGLPTLIPSIALNIGYTAMFFTYEDLLIGEHTTPSVPESDYRTITKTGPLFTGIDLQLRYSGIQNMRITLNNNISFGSAGEPVYDDNLILNYSVGFDNNNLAQYHSQSWFALYNALAVRYQVSSLMTAYLEAIHRMGRTTINNSNDGRLDWGKSVRVKMMLETSAYVKFNLSSSVEFDIGASLFYENNSTKFSNYLDGLPEEPTSWSGGGLGFSVPVRLVFRW